jgi:hypothetical protein
MTQCRPLESSENAFQEEPIPLSFDASSIGSLAEEQSLAEVSHDRTVEPDTLENTDNGEVNEETSSLTQLTDQHMEVTNLSGTVVETTKASKKHAGRLSKSELVTVHKTLKKAYIEKKF